MKFSSFSVPKAGNSHSVFQIFYESSIDLLLSVFGITIL